MRPASMRPEIPQARSDHEKEYEELKITHTTEHTRAYIKVQDGCNQFCSYCIIPPPEAGCEAGSLPMCSMKLKASLRAVFRRSSSPVSI